MKKHGLKALGLSLLAVLGLMAFTAAGAQASGKFLIEGVAGAFEETIGGNVENALTGSLLILKLNLELFCHEGSATGKISDTGHGHATVLFKKCLVQQVSNDGTDTLIGEPCEIPDIVAKALALVILHSGGASLGVDLSPPSATKTEHNEPKVGDAYVLFTPLEGTVFTTLLNHINVCTPLETNIGGCLVAKVENPNVHEVEKLITTKAMLTLFGCALNFGAHASHLNVDAKVFLTGVNMGKKWGAA